MTRSLVLRFQDSGKGNATIPSSVPASLSRDTTCGEMGKIGGLTGVARNGYFARQVPDEHPATRLDSSWTPTLVWS